MVLYNYLESIADDVATRLNANEKYAFVICVTLKDSTFKRYSHQKKLVNAVCSCKDIFNVSKEILNEMYDNRPIRLIGIRTDKLVDKLYHQESIFDDMCSECPAQYASENETPQKKWDSVRK